MNEPVKRVTIARIPAGQSLELFSSLCGFFGAALEGCLISAGDGYGNAADVITGEGMAERDVVRSLRRATRGLGKKLPDPAPEDEPDEELADDPLTLNRMRKSPEGGVEFGIGGATDMAREFAAQVIAAFIPAFDEHPTAVNYLSWDAVDPNTHKTYSLIVVKPNGLTPHEARQKAEQECDRLRALLVANGIDPDTQTAKDV